MRRFILIACTTMLALATGLPAAGDDEIPAGSNLAIALKAGAAQADVKGVDTGPAFGLEVSADNLLLQPFAGKVRDMLSLNRVDYDGLELTTVEWNAHWAFQTRRDIWIGAGPGIGYVWTDGRSTGDGIGFQLGGSVTYLTGHALIGIESRYQWTEAEAADNWLTMAKVGWRF